MDHKTSRVFPKSLSVVLSARSPGLPASLRLFFLPLSKQVKTWPAQGPPCLEKPGLTLGGLW